MLKDVSKIINFWDNNKEKKFSYLDNNLLK